MYQFDPPQQRPQSDPKHPPSDTTYKVMFEAKDMGECDVIEIWPFRHVELETILILVGPSLPPHTHLVSICRYM